MAFVSVPAKQDFDWLRAEMVGFIRTQLVAAAATLCLAEQLQDGGRRAEDFAAAGLEPATAFPVLRASTEDRRGRLQGRPYLPRHLGPAGLRDETPGSLRQFRNQM